MFLKRMIARKKGVVTELTTIIIVSVVLVVMAAAAILLIRGKGGDSLEFIKNLLRFGRGG